MDAFEALDRSRVEFRRVLAGVGHEHWELATPCEGWDVRDVEPDGVWVRVGLGADVWVAVGCGEHNVNATSNAFGNGIFDGWSIVTGHEYAEAVTDPDNFGTWQDGWLDAQGSENGDKCAWLDTQNITLGSHQFAVQPLWSNEAYDATGNGCVVSR